MCFWKEVSERKAFKLKKKSWERSGPAPLRKFFSLYWLGIGGGIKKNKGKVNFNLLSGGSPVGILKKLKKEVEYDERVLGLWWIFWFKRAYVLWWQGVLLSAMYWWTFYDMSKMWKDSEEEGNLERFLWGKNVLWLPIWTSKTLQCMWRVVFGRGSEAICYR